MGSADSFHDLPYTEPVYYWGMERRSFLTVAAALPAIILTPSLAVAKPQPRLSGAWQDLLHVKILHAEELARTDLSKDCRDLRGSFDSYLIRMSHTQENRALVNAAFERVNWSRLQWFKDNPSDTSFDEVSLKSLASFFRHRRFQSYRNNPVSNLLVTPQWVRFWQAQGLITDCEYLCSPNTWKLTTHLVERLGWDTVCKAIGV